MPDFDKLRILGAWPKLPSTGCLLKFGVSHPVEKSGSEKVERAAWLWAEEALPG